MPREQWNLKVNVEKQPGVVRFRPSVSHTGPDQPSGRLDRFISMQVGEDGRWLYPRIRSHGASALEQGVVRVEYPVKVTFGIAPSGDPSWVVREWEYTVEPRQETE